METLKNKKIAILTESSFKESELLSPKKALEESGVTVHIVSPQRGKIMAMKNHEWSAKLPVYRTISDVNSADYDGLYLPGEVLNSDQLRSNKEPVKFLRDFFEAGKPVASICYSPQTLIEAGVVKGRRMTSYPSVKTDLINAVAKWVDEDVVIDEGLITARSPKDLPAFNKKLIQEFAMC